MWSNNSNEWLEPDGFGVFTSGTVNTIRTRRYHGLLLTATSPPTGRVMLVNGFDAWVETPGGRVDLSAQRYGSDVIHPRGHERITAFASEPWPTWTFDIGRASIRLELLGIRRAVTVLARWSICGDVSDVTLHVRPLISGRDYHSTQHENATLDFTTRVDGERLEWRPYASLPMICSRTNGRWEQAPAWYRNFLYTEERARGLDDTEDLASPGVLHFDLSRGPAIWMLGTGSLPDLSNVDAMVSDEATRRGSFSSSLLRAADAYLVARGTGKTIVAGYPWFTDWGRDTFIAMRGLCLATNRLVDARDILLEWAPTVSQGMLPNRFPDSGAAPEYNSVDAALWFVVTTGELLMAASSRDEILTRFDRDRLEHAIVSVLEELSAGTRYGIRCDRDGLLACGVPGVQLTWMDAKVGDHVITPRIGKPVEIQALWIAALQQGALISHRWEGLLQHARQSFDARFWNADAECLFDVVDVDHVAGVNDATIRPNQIFAVGGLPSVLLSGVRARRVVDAVEAHLWTPLGLRTLSPTSPDYVAHYEGGPSARDAAYHQGAAWPWLIAAFVDAWLNVRHDSADARQEARRRFLAPFDAHLGVAGLGHVSEIVDGAAPHTPRGCPFQAWSVGELIRLRERLSYT
jgi:predicted glycogen debranching enzyme